MHFNKLGGDRGVEIGGTKGKDLTASVRQTHVDFEQVLLNPKPYTLYPKAACARRTSTLIRRVSEKRAWRKGERGFRD